MADDAEPRKEPVDEPEAFVVERMQAGEDQEAIAAQLEERGVERGEARRIVGSTYDEVARAAEAERYTPSALVPAIVGGLLAALVGAAAWAAIVVLTDYEIGFAAWGIGFLAGFAVVLFTRGRKGLPLQVIAVAASILGILLGKYASYVYILKDVAREEAGEEAAADVSLFSSEVFGFFMEDFDVVFSGFDLLWIGLAVITAWRIPRGLGIDLRRSPVSHG